MAKEVKSVEERIVSAYMGEDGMWIVERGKMKECSLLKEAVARINELKDKLNRANQTCNELNREKNTEWFAHRQKMRDEEDVLKRQRIDLKTKEQRFNEKFEGLRAYMNLLHTESQTNET